MRKFYLLFVALLSATHIWAYNCKINEICYNLDWEAHTATVTYSGYPYNNDYTGHYGGGLKGAVINIPSTIEYNNVEYTVTSIGDDAFYDSGSNVLMASFTIPSTVTSIGSRAFWKCTNLTSFTIPSSVTTIGDHAFDWCSNLTTVIVEREIPLSITSETFSNRTNATLYVPYGSKAAYEAADYWKEFKEIVEMPAPSPIIEFADANVKALCVANWDTNSDGELSEAEAAAVTSLGEVFKINTSITSFNELQYFTGLTSIENCAFDRCTGLTSIEIPNSVTSIGSDAFYCCTSLISVTIPNGVTTIGNDAFRSCSSLTTIELHCAQVDSWFMNLTSINEVIIGEEVTTIKSSAFKGCSGLSSITIPNSVTSIGNNAFQNCTGLTSVTIGNGVTSIGYYAFNHCYSLTSVTIGNSVTSIGMNAFYGCSSLTSINIPNSMTSIGTDAFSGCSNLTSVELHCAQVGANWFSGLPILELIIGEEVTNLGFGPFAGCSSNLNSIIVKSGNSVYDSRNQCNAIIKTSTNVLISGCKTTEIPNGVTSIGGGAFSGCSSLTSINIPSSVTSIGGSAFYNCSSLTSISVPEGVTSIGGYAFNGCSGLTSVEIPNSVSSIGQRAFEYCSTLTSVTINNATPISITSSTFSNSANAALKVPAGSKAAYEAADYWKEFKEIIEMPAPSPNIVFTDANVKALCVANWDTNGDGELSEAEAAAVTSLGEVFHFADITSFNEFRYFTGLTSVEDCAFDRCHFTSIEIPNSVTSIGYLAFYATGLTSVIIPNSVTSIGIAAFQGCGGLTSIDIPNSVTSIGHQAFNGCRGLTSIEIPNSVTSIEVCAFSSCPNLASIKVEEGNSVYDSRENCNAIIETSSNRLHTGCKNTIIPNSVTSICDAAFVECSGLTSIEIPNSVTGIGGYAFNGSDLASIEIPNSVTSIGFYSFKDCSSLTSVTIGNSVLGIDDGVFQNCSNLSSVTIGNSVKRIDDFVFQNCSNLTSITIPNSVTSIGQEAFDGCSNLTSVVVEISTPLAISENTFTNRANATLNVPAGSKTAYEAADYWKEFKEIVEIDNGGSGGGEEEDTDISSMSNVIYLNKVEARTNTQISLPIQMKNSAAIRGFQFDLYLPEGVTVVKNAKGKILASLSNGRLPEDDEHSLTLSEQTDGSIRFLCGSLYDETFTGNDGEIATLTVQIDENMADGDYAVILRNIKLTETDISKFYETDYVKSTLTISSYMLGDINDDQQVDVSDYIGIANHILGSTPQGFNMKAADVNEDGNIDVSDYIGVANIILTGSVYGNSNARVFNYVKEEEEETQDVEPE